MLISFFELLRSKYHGKEVAVRCIVSGKSSPPYSIPKRVEIKCRKGKECAEYCSAYKKDSFIIESTDSILKFLDVNESSFPNVLKAIYKIDCNEFKFDIKSFQNIERIFIAAPTGKERIKDTSNYVCYFVGYGIDTNTLYELKGIPTNEPKTQTATCVFTEAKKIKNDIEAFSLSKEINNGLKVFETDIVDAETIMLNLCDVYDSYASNITKIYNRTDLHMCLDVAFHSPLAFKFDGTFVYKGWIDTAIIGDTACGKSDVSREMMKYYGVGEIVKGENVSMAGLVVGLQQYDKQWAVTWGKIPLNDTGLLAIDEAGGLGDQLWSNLTGIRSDGIAETTKIVKQSTNARTRLIFLLNPIGKTVDNFSYGIQSIMDAVKCAEDVRRFDYVLVVSKDEVSLDDINRPHSHVKEFYTKDLEQQLVMWIWSRKSSDIVFSDDAIARVYSLSKSLGKLYSPVIPLIHGANIRIKLAKLAICFAGRLHSNKSGGKILYVDTHHVDCAYVFLNTIYSKDCSGYKAMSMLQKIFDESANEENISSIEHYFRTFGTRRVRLLKCLLQNSTVTSKDLIEHVNITDVISHEIISKLLDKGMIVKRGLMYAKTPGFTTWLKQAVMKEIGRS